MITYGETAMDKLLQWLRSSGEPKELEDLVRQYLELLSKLVTEETE
ncbi:MAG: hypothetical protein AB4911_19345 [Oscillochloridaceae bacterium umkhey_bin13]